MCSCLRCVLIGKFLSACLNRRDLVGECCSASTGALLNILQGLEYLTSNKWHLPWSIFDWYNGQRIFMPSNTGNYQLQLFHLFSSGLGRPDVKIIELIFLHPCHVWSVIKKKKNRLISVNFNQSAVNANACILTLKCELKIFMGSLRSTHACLHSWIHTQGSLNLWSHNRQSHIIYIRSSLCLNAIVHHYFIFINKRKVPIN